MRTIIRPAVVGLAAVGMALGGAASAQASGHHHSSSHTHTNVNVFEKKWSSEIEHSFNDNQVNYKSPGAFNFGDLEQD